jgi:hypothetical protein
MNAAQIIALVTQSAQLVAGVSTLVGFPMGAKAAAIAPLLAQLAELIDEAKAALTGDDLAVLEAQLEVIHPEVLALSAVLDAELAQAAQQPS